MNNFKQYLILLISFINISCEDLFESDYSEKELEIVEECKADPFITEAGLEVNLIGEWKQIAASCNGCIEGTSERDLIFKFFENKSGVVKDGGHETNMTWDVIQMPDGNFKIETEPRNCVEDINCFCSEYMLVDNEFFLYIYKKQ